VRHPFDWHWLWKAAAAGACGSLTHLSLMYFKTGTGLLSAFDPYAALQAKLGLLAGKDVHWLLPWALSFVSGAIPLGFLFGRLYAQLPGGSGIAKGFVFGLIGWAVMGSLFFPLVGLGFFAAAAGLGAWPALFSLVMLLTYSLVLGAVYAALNP